MTLIAHNLMLHACAGRAAEAARRRLLVVRNPLAGIAASRLCTDVEERLAAHGVAVTHYDAGQLEAIGGLASHAHDVDAVVAAGGDGTIRALAAALLGTGVPLGIIPAGTGNVMATEIGAPSHPDAIAAMLMTGPIVEIESASANGAPFLLMAGAGFDARILGRLNLAAKRRVGKLAYAAPTLAVLSRLQAPFQVRVDGAEHEACWIVATNARHYAGRFVISPSADVRRPGLHAVLLAPKGRIGMADALVRLALGRHDGVSGLTIVPARRIEVASAQPIQADGDYLGSGPLLVESGGPRLALIVPAASLSAPSQPAAR